MKNRNLCSKKSQRVRQRQLKIARLRKQNIASNLYELLEPRRVLNAVPIAINNLDYETPVNTPLEITVATNGVLANDFDAEGATITAVSFGNAENGALSSSSSDGTFTFTPDTDFEGIASFTYQASDSVNTSQPAIVKIAVGAGLSAQLNGDERGVTDNPLHSGILSLAQPLGSGVNLIYRSDTTPVLLVPVETFLTSVTSIPNSVTATLTIDSVNSTSYFSNSNLTTDEPLRIVGRAVTTSQATGMYDWDLTITLKYNGSSDIVRTFSGQQAIVNRLASPFGKNWWVDNLDQLYEQSNGTLLVNGDGTTLWFEKNGSNFLPAEGDLSFSTLVDTGTEFELTDKWGNKRVFDSNGYITSIERLNNSVPDFTFSYASGKIDEITDQFDRTFSFEFNATTGKLEGITDFAGRTTDVVVDANGLLDTVMLGETAPGEFNTTGYTAPEWDYDYVSISGNYFIDAVTDPDSVTTEYAYTSYTRRLSRIDYADGSKWYLYPALSQGVATAGGVPILHVDDVDARYKNELGKEFHFRTDQFGNVTYFKDALDYETTYEFDSQNLLYRVSQEAEPSTPSNPGPHPQPITKYGYNQYGDLVKTVNADWTSTRATYHSTLHLVTQYWNELNETETYSYSSDGDLESYTDGEGNTWTYTYDAHGNVLTETSPDPDGTGGPLAEIVTTFTYETTIYNRLDKITWEDNEYRTFEYTLSDQLKSVTDELGRVTAYEYDPLDRLVEMTLPDPDGVGYGVDAPVYTFAYDANLQLSSETDPLGNTTSYEYHATRHWLTKITMPDPDGSTEPLTSPEFVYTYNGGGQLITEVRPEFDGTSISYTYTDNGQLATKTGPVAQQVYTYSYDHLGRLSTVTDPSSRLITYKYDMVNQLTHVIDHDPDGSGSQVGPTTEYQYDYAGRLSKIIDPLGRETAYSYYNNGLIETMTLPDPDKSGPFDAPVYSYEYDALGRLVKTIDPGTRETKSVYDTRHRVIEFFNHDPDGEGPLNPTSTEYAYDEVGRLLTETNALDQVTTFEYDDLDRLTKLYLPDPDTGQKTTSSPTYVYGYDQVGNLTSFTDALNETTTIEYDKLNRRTEITQPDPDGSQTSPIWTYVYNDFGQLEEIIDPMNHSTTRGYDTAGRLTSISDPFDKATTYAYDLLNRVETVTAPDPDGGDPLEASVTDYDYDIYSRVVTMTDSNSGEIHATYDIAGQLLSLTDASNNVTIWAYDDLGRIAMETDQEGYTRSFNYNAVDRLVRQTDRLGRVIWFTLDGYTESEEWYEYSSGNLPAAIVETTTEGGAGNDEVQTVTLENLGPGIGYGEGYFRLAFGGEVTAPLLRSATAANLEAALEELAGIDDVTVSKTNDEFTITFGGNLEDTNVPQLIGDIITDNKGNLVHTIERTYDAIYRLTNIDDTTVNYTFAYDELGRLITQTEDHAALPNVVLSFDYDANGNRTEMAASVNGTADYLNSYAYDELNRLVSVTQQGNSGNTVASKHVAFAYNALGQTTSVNRYNNTVATDPALRTVFGYDGANRLDAITHQKVTSGGSATTLHGYTFEFDDVGRITEIDSTLDGVSLFEFDELNQLVGADHAGNRDDEDYELDATGNRDDSYYDVGTRNLTTTDGTYNYEYDKEGNRIKRTEISSGDYEDYEWDHRNRLVSIKSYASGGGAVTRSITYEYDAFNRLTHREYDADGDGSANPTDTFFAGFDGLGSTLEFDDNTANDLSHRYLWGLNDQLLADEIIATGEILWALADQVGTIRDIGRWNDTNSEFEIANHRVYDSFGNLTSESDPSVDLAFGFTGRWTDPETGLTHHLNRWLDPAIGKWLSNDPIGFGGGDANIQRYVLNNPLSFSDNTGFGIDPGGGGGGGGGGGDDVMGTSGINQGADQGSSDTSTGKKQDEDATTWGQNKAKEMYEWLGERTKRLSGVAELEKIAENSKDPNVKEKVGNAAQALFNMVVDDDAAADPEKPRLRIRLDASTVVSQFKDPNFVPPNPAAPLPGQKLGQELGAIWFAAIVGNGKPKGGLFGKNPGQILENKPKNWTKQPARGNGWVLVDENGNERIRFMRPDKNGKFHHNETGYWRLNNENGDFLDEFGNIVPVTDPDFHIKTHIPFTGVRK